MLQGFCQTIRNGQIPCVPGGIDVNGLKNYLKPLTILSPGAEKNGDNKMKLKLGMRVLSLLLVFALIGAMFVPAVSAESDRRFEEELLKNAGIKVNNLDTESLEYEVIGDKTFIHGNIKFDAEAGIGGKSEKIVANQEVNGYYCNDGSFHIESVGSKFRSVTDAQLVFEDSDSIKFRIEQSVTKNGVTEKSSDIVTYEKKGTDTKKSNELITTSENLKSGKTKIDIPSAAPSGATLIFNDIRYSDVKWGAAALAVIATYFGVLPGVIIGLIAVALAAAEDYGDVDGDDIYLDFWTPGYGGQMIYVEIDYLYI